MLLLTILAMGCSPDGRERFTGGGTHVDPNADNTGGDDSGMDDTGSESFRVSAVEAGFEDLPNIGVAIFAFVSVENFPDNVDGSRIHVSLDGESIEIEGEAGIPIDDSYAWVVTETGEIFTAIEVQGMGSYEMELYIKTGAGVASDGWAGTVDSENERELPAKP